jgi:hypothetical protein
MKPHQLVLKIIIMLSLSLIVVHAHANTAEPLSRSLCVYDPGGETGDFFKLMQDYQVDVLAAKPAGEAGRVNFELKVYTDEQTAFDDFNAKKCHAVVVTGTRARSLQRFTGSLEAMGALPNYKLLKRIIKSLSSPKAAKLMKSGDYESAGIAPGGAVYLYVRDRNLNTVERLSGKKIATLSFDEAAKTMVKKIGASMISAEISTFAGMFNNGTVEACYAPAFAYKALELHKGIGAKGGVVQYPLAQVTLQVIIRSKDFPEDFPQASRKIVAKYASKAIKAAKKAEQAITNKGHWIEISKADKERYDEMFLGVRVELRDTLKIYHKYALKLMRKLRCKADKSRAECVGKSKE